MLPRRFIERLAGGGAVTEPTLAVTAHHHTRPNNPLKGTLRPSPLPPAPLPSVFGGLCSSPPAAAPPVRRVLPSVPRAAAPRPAAPSTGCTGTTGVLRLGAEERHGVIQQRYQQACLPRDDRVRPVGFRRGRHGSSTPRISLRRFGLRAEHRPGYPGGRTVPEQRSPQPADGRRRIAVACNVSGVDKLVLTLEVTANIFNGTITTWNDPQIANLNPA